MAQSEHEQPNSPPAGPQLRLIMFQSADTQWLQFAYVTLNKDGKVIAAAPAQMAFDTTDQVGELLPKMTAAHALPVLTVKFADKRLH